MILQRASSLSCAATPLPQTFATRRFYHYEEYRVPANVARALRVHRNVACPGRFFDLRHIPLYHVLSELAPRYHSALRTTQDHPAGLGVSRRFHRWLHEPTTTKLTTASQRNRRAQPPRLPARVPPVRRSVDPTEPDETTGASPRRLLP